MSVTLPSLPFGTKALEPYISEKTLEFHHGKHHNAYVVNLNKLIEGTALDNDDLETIIKISAADPAKTAIFNNAAQVWNHTFYWNCIAPGGGGNPNGKIADMIDAAFGNYETFLAEFKSAGATQFGSGWAWLVDNKGKLEVLKTSNAGLPLTSGLKALLTVDVWEHAYYLDYQNRRPDYLSIFTENLINWDFVNSLV